MMLAMSGLTETIQHEIAERHRRHPGRPDRELLEHLVVAVQRERVAAVGFDTRRLGERLAGAPLPDEVRQAIVRSVAQIWLDENMHARYVLGVLLQQPRLRFQLEALFENIEGGVGGWMTAVKQHTTLQDAPLDGAAAALLHAGALLAGRIPAEARPSLVRAPLRDWCAFSADAERSAVESFARMEALAAELAARLDWGDLAAPAGLAAELARMQHDESVHLAIFQAIGAALGDDDRLLPGVIAADLVAQLAALGASVSPAPSLGHAPEGHLVVVARGERAEDKIATFDRALDQAGFFERIAAQARAAGRSIAEARVVIKIDLMLAYHRDDRSTHVDPDLVARLTDRLGEHGYRDIVVCDARNIYSRYYENRTVERVGEYVGLRPVRYRLVDLSLELEPHTFHRGMGVYEIGRSWRDADIRVSFAKMKTHPVAVAQLTLRNAGLVVPQGGEYFFDDRVSDFAAVAMSVLHEFPVHFGIVDGYDDAADGLLGVLADPTPKHPQIIVAGDDLACVDHAALLLMGERDPSRVPDLRVFLDWFGDPRSGARVIGDLTPIADWDAADEGLLAAPLAALAAPVYASLSRRGALFTADMDPVAFPPRDETSTLAAARKALRLFLGATRPAAR
jgi:uncharacterized protein (DUF362 family)